jgi:trigger factor
MQITQTVSEDLHRQFTVTVPASELDSRVTARLTEMQPKMHLKGFRPGKAPISFLKKQYGKSLLGEIVEQAVNEGSQKAVSDNQLKPALTPRIEPVGDVQQVVDGKADLQFTVTVDLMPEFQTADVSTLKVERLTAEVSDADVDEALQRIAQQARDYTPRPEGEPAQKDDTVTIDFVGSVDGVEFEGGKGENFNLTLGAGQFIPGFEDQLIGAKAGESRDVKVTFPADYHSAEMAGKDAVFAVTVKEVKAPAPVAFDDALAQKMGLDTIGTLRERIREQVKSEFTSASRLHLKRRILDALDSAHSFPLPPQMVEGEFKSIWAQVEAELQREGKTAADEGKTDEELRAEYHAIAERRVRLGLVLGRLGEQNGITITPDEVQRAILNRVRQYPGHEQRLYEYFTKNPQAQAEIRAPLFEDKVVDFIAELAQITDKTVDRETLFKDPDDLPETVKAATAS